MIYGSAPKPGTGNLSSLLSSFFSLIPPTWPVRPYHKTHLVVTPSPLVSLSSLLPPGSCWFSVSSTPCSPRFPRRPSPSTTRSPLLLNRAHHPRGIPTFLTAATAFIPSNVSGRRAYKDGPEFNKSDNVRVYIVSRLAVPDNRQRIDFTNANTFQRFSNRLINPS